MPAAASNEQLRCAQEKKSATARALVLARKRSTRACGVRAPLRAGWSRPMPRGCPLRHFHGHPPRCTAVFRHASRSLQQAAFLRMCARKNATARSLFREVTQHARLRRARAAPRWLNSILVVPMRPPHHRQSSVVRGKVVVLRASLGLARGRPAHVRKRAATVRALCGKEAQHARLLRARATPRGLELALWF